MMGYAIGLVIGLAIGYSAAYLIHKPSRDAKGRYK